MPEDQSTESTQTSSNPETGGPKPGTCSEPGDYARGNLDSYETGQSFLDNIQTKNL